MGHADWYAGNTAISGGVLVGTFDWELVADTEAVIAGFAAACYGASSTGPAGLSTPEDVALFMRDYDNVRSERLRDRECRTAVGAAAWILAFNARWQVALIDQIGAELDMWKIVSQDDTVEAAALTYANGDLERLKRAVALALRDWRDLLVLVRGG